MEKHDLPSCFGVLDKVFPMGGDGLRESPETCLLCDEKTECLRRALKGREKFWVAEEKLDNTYHSGHMGFLSRWSRKKALVLKKRRNSEE